MTNEFIRGENGHYVRRSAITRIRVFEAVIPGVRMPGQPAPQRSGKWRVSVSTAGGAEGEWELLHTAASEAEAHAWAEQNILP